MNYQETEAPEQTSSWLTAQPVTKVQQTSTRLRFLLVLLPLGAIFYFIDQHRPEVWLLAVTVSLFGEFLQVWASAHLHKNLDMITSGPYSWVRNPMYFGRFFVALGFLLLIWRWYIILPHVLFFILYAHARVLGEEKRLRGLFGEPYSNYCRTVNRWFPRRPRPPLSNRRWSWKAVRRNHQLRVSAGVILAFVLLWVRANLV